MNLLFFYKMGEDSFLLFWDLRGGTLMGGYWESHEDDITCIRFLILVCFQRLDIEHVVPFGTFFQFYQIKQIKVLPCTDYHEHSISFIHI